MKASLSSTMKISFLFSGLLFFFLLKPSQSATICNPHDKKVLLQIKNYYFHNASTFSTWNPKTNCCKWSNTGCNDDANPGRITYLFVTYDNDVSGPIPPMVGDLPFLASLGFYHLPNLTGLIPPTIIKLTKLKILQLTTNNLTGFIPDFLSRINSLQQLDLSNNRFYGTIPSSLSSLPNIFKLDLFSNKLTGSIPESFGSFKNNISLQLFDNDLSGTIPRSLGHAKLINFDVFRNKLTGDVSFLFARDKPLKSIRLRRNKFKFDFTNLDLPHGLQLIDISQNKIHGSLPKRLGQLPLYYIDVSRNQLCGRIPTGLKDFSPSKFAHNKCLCDVPLAPCKK